MHQLISAALVTDADAQLISAPEHPASRPSVGGWETPPPISRDCYRAGRYRLLYPTFSRRVLTICLTVVAYASGSLHDAEMDAPPIRFQTRTKLANKGHDTRALQAYLGHRNIQHTVRYTELSPGRFKDFWR